MRGLNTCVRVCADACMIVAQSFGNIFLVHHYTNTAMVVNYSMAVSVSIAGLSKLVVGIAECVPWRK